MNAPRYEGFLPGTHLLDGYRAGGFHFGGMSHRGSILALPSGIYAWDAGDFESLGVEDFRRVIDEPKGAVELLLVGTGEFLRPLPRAIRMALNATGIRVDVMATHHAVPTYNLLLGERRKVAAALLTTPPGPA